MQLLQNGQFFGDTSQTIQLPGLTLTDTVYTHDRVAWHWHENAYFTLILTGGLVETSRRETFECTAGSLLFHNSQEPHYNVKPSGFTRGFHVELSADWFDAADCSPSSAVGSISIDSPTLRQSMYGVLKEAKLEASSGGAAIDSLLVRMFAEMGANRKTLREERSPRWTRTLRDLLHEPREQGRSLAALAEILQIHPVHLSRAFPRYFGCTLGEYLRTTRVQRSLSLLPDHRLTLTRIAFECGFSDQSHFTRCFKALNGVTPSRYRRLLSDG